MEIRKASSIRKEIEANKPRIQAWNPNSEPVSKKERFEVSALESPAQISIGRRIEEAAPHTTRVRHRKFLGYLDPAGNPDSEVFARAGICRCGGAVYKTIHDPMGAFLECGKCGAHGVDSPITNLPLPAAIRIQGVSRSRKKYANKHID